MAGDHKTFQLRYVGPRFAGARLPLDVLSDLPAFRDLLVAYAKEAWRARNSDRQRLPRGFDSSISFDLVAIEKGSAIPRLDWNRERAQATLPGFADELKVLVDQSYLQLLNLIDGAGQGRIPHVVSSEKIRALNKLGSALRADERIEFIESKGADEKIVFLDLKRRKTLITAARDTYQARFEGIGRLLGSRVDGDQVRGYIDVQTVEHGNIQIELGPDRIIDEFDGNIGSDVQFVLQIELDDDDTLRGIVDVYDVEMTTQINPDLIRCQARLEDLKALDHGWYNGKGAPVSAGVLINASNFLTKTATFTGFYRIYPTDEGGVQLEFENRGWDYSIDFRPDGTIEMYGVEVKGADELEPKSFVALDDVFYRYFNSQVER